MKLDRVNFEKYVKGYFIVDCVVRKKDIFYFVAEQDENTIETDSKGHTKIISCISRPGTQPWGAAELKGMQRLKAGVSLLPKEQFIGVSLNDHVYVIGSGEVGGENDLKGSNSKQLREAKAKHEEYLLRGGIHKLRTIEGYLFGVGLGRTIIMRRGRNDWHYFTELPKDKSVLDDTGFADIDGFSLTDIYAAGGHGDLWHYDGKKWLQLPFPSNMGLNTVCCGGDGEVYIGADGGTVYQGRGDRWKRIHVGDMTLPYRDMVWHQNKVWCTNDHGIAIIENGKHKKPELPDWVRVCAGHMSAGDGVLLVAGVYGAAMHDGKDWHKVIDYDDLA